MSWEVEHKELGRVVQNTTQVVQFNWRKEESEKLEVTLIEASCGCTSPVYDEVTGILRATFKAGKIPKHLVKQGYYTTTKSIRMSTNKGNFKLTFKATIIK